MRLTVNFEPEEFPGATMTVEELLKLKRYSFPLIIVRIGGILVERSNYANARLKDGDEVELYHLVSGG